MRWLMIRVGSSLPFAINANISSRYRGESPMPKRMSHSPVSANAAGSPIAPACTPTIEIVAFGFEHRVGSAPARHLADRLADCLRIRALERDRADVLRHR